MRIFFNPEKGIWGILGIFGELLLLSMLWFLCSVPLLTLGGATTALYDTVYHCIRREESDFFSRYFGTLKAEMKQSLLSTLLWLAVLTLLFLLFRVIRDSGMPDVLKVALYCLMLIPIGTACWVPALRSRFTMSFPALTVTALKLSLAHIFRTLLLGLLTLLSALVSLYTLLPVMFLPGILLLIWTWILEPVFQKYMEEDTP